MSEGPIRRLVASPFDLELWTVDLATAPVAPARLSRAELSRAARFVFEQHRRNFLAAHCALAELLATRLGMPDVSLQYELGANGKPRLPLARDCVFNMSHCDDLALIAIATGLPDDVEIGVDVECLREVRDATELAAANFTPRERLELAACRTEPARAFLQGWTRKEACLKAIGSGLTIAPASFDCGLGTHAGVTEIDGVRVEFDSLDLGAGHIAAVAIIPAGARIARAVVH